MLIARAPVRISFAGGGTDLPAYYDRFGGLVVSAAINRYFYCFVNVNESSEIQITSSDYRTFYRHRRDRSLIWDGDLALPKAILHHFDVNAGVAMFLASEVPPGTGLGSSSTVAVAIIKALAVLRGQSLAKAEIGDLACRIEIDKLGMPIGKQDQYAAAFGGINAIRFGSIEEQGRVTVTPLAVDPDVVRRLERKLMLFFTGSSRNSSTILSQQSESSGKSSSQTVEALHAIKAMADEARGYLETGNIDELGRLLHRGWEQKKLLARGVSNSRIDRYYETALANGAIGGKITGAGGGGFLMLYCDERHQDAVTGALEEEGLARMDFRFDFGGARVLLNAGRLLPSPDFPIRLPELAGV